MSTAILKTRKQKFAEIRKEKMRARNQKVTATTIVGAIAALTLMSAKVGACSTDYTVKKGDTLYSLAKKYQVTIDQLMEVNGLASEKIYINQELLVPYLSSTQLEEDTSGIHIVKKGDTLYSLSKKYQISTDLLMVANGLTSEKIKVGQQLLVPYDIPTTKPIPSSHLEDISSIYTVKKGDTLFSLAKKHQITVHELKKANNIKSDQIYVGQSILVPSEFHNELIDEEMYTVVPGDTLWDIAKRFGVTIEDVKKENNLLLDMVIIGQQLHIPGTAYYTEVEVIGTADSYKVEFNQNGEQLILSVPYGTSDDYQKISEKKITLIHKNGAVISYF